MMISLSLDCVSRFACSYLFAKRKVQKKYNQSESMSTGARGREKKTAKGPAFLNAGVRRGYFNLIILSERGTDTCFLDIDPRSSTISCAWLPST